MGLYFSNRNTNRCKVYRTNTADNPTLNIHLTIEKKIRSHTREVETSEIEGYAYSFRYEEFIAPMIEVIPRQPEATNGLKREVETLKQQVSALLSTHD